MTPIPGIVASQITGHLSTNSFESIATYVVGSTAQTSITFSGIPSTYKHLQLRSIVRSSTGASPENLAYMQFNSDTGTNYSDHFLLGTGAVTAANADVNSVKMPVVESSNSGTLANVFGATVLDILDYADTNKYKTVKSICGTDANGSGNIFLTSGSWRNTAAISTITIIPEKVSFVQYSSFALYGIKG